MQKAGTKIYFQKNKAIMFDKETDLRFTTSGHYYIPLKTIMKHSSAFQKLVT